MEYYKLKDINEPMVKIEGSNDTYITPTAKVYRWIKGDIYRLKTPYLNKHNGYLYIGVSFENIGTKTCRLHRLVAKAFIPNPNNYDIVGHKNNIKHDDRVENLYWTTVSENTKKAFDDGLAKNDKGYDDSQSFPIIAYNIKGEEIGRFGSVSECHRALGVSKSTILRWCNNEIKGKSRCGYTFKFDK